MQRHFRKILPLFEDFHKWLLEKDERENAAERAIKPFVMARKNFLFSGSGKGAESSCFHFSLIETAKANDISLEDYLRCFLKKHHMPIQNPTGKICSHGTYKYHRSNSAVNGLS